MCSPHVFWKSLYFIFAPSFFDLFLSSSHCQSSRRVPLETDVGMSLVERMSPLLSPGTRLPRDSFYLPRQPSHPLPGLWNSDLPRLLELPGLLFHMVEDEFIQQYRRKTRLVPQQQRIFPRQAALKHCKNDDFYTPYLRRPAPVKKRHPTQITAAPSFTPPAHRKIDPPKPVDILEEETVKSVPQLPSEEPGQSARVRLPNDFTQCPMDHLITLISRMLRQLIALNDTAVPAEILRGDLGHGASKALLTRYHSRTPPGISVSTYLGRLVQFNNLTCTTLLTTVYYIDLLLHYYQPFFTLNSWTVHRFLLVATMVLQKLMEDFFYTNEHYAKVGGVAASELNCLELDFLTRVDWRCIPTKMVDGKHLIKYVRDILEVYYCQLIQLMGRSGSVVFESEAERKRRLTG